MLNTLPMLWNLTSKFILFLLFTFTFKVFAGNEKHCQDPLLGQTDETKIAHSQKLKSTLNNMPSEELRQLYETVFFLSTTTNTSILDSKILEKVDLLREHLTYPELLSRLRIYLTHQQQNDFLGKVLVQTRKELPKPKIERYSSLKPTRLSDQNDFLRGFGFRLLSLDNPTFNDPSFLIAHQKHTGFRGTGAAEGESRLFFDYRSAWKETLGNESEPILFAQTGSDANNLIFDILEVLGKKNGRPGIVLGSFEGIYGAGRGTLSGSGAFTITKSADRGTAVRGITLPHVPYIEKAEENLTAEELAHVQKAEDEFFKILDHARQHDHLGGILLETMAARNNRIGSSRETSTRWISFRQEFLAELRRYCSTHNIYIFVDEIMNFGRTGSRFSWDHFPEFTPDFFTFGKGSYIAGVAQVKNRFNPPFDISRPYFEVYDRAFSGGVLESVTLKAPPASLIEGMQILKAIKEQDLFTKSKEVSQYFKEKLRERCATVEGVGMHLFVKGCNFIGLRIASVEILYDRILPPIDMNKQDVDWLFSEQEE